MQKSEPNLAALAKVAACKSHSSLARMKNLVLVCDRKVIAIRFGNGLIFWCARVAELADALDSGSSE